MNTKKNMVQTDNSTKKLLKITRIIALVIIGIITVFMGLRSAGVWLLVRDTIPDQVDVVFTFAGDRHRVFYSRELMLKFSGAHWLLSDYIDGYAKILRKNDFDMSRVTVVDTCENTIAEVQMLFRFLEENIPKLPQKTVVALVSSPYHMRRIQLMVRHQKKLDHVDFKYTPVPLDRYNVSKEMYKKWWNYSVISDVVFSELPKILYFYIFQ